MSDELIYRAAQTVKDAGIGLQISCIYGSPGETPTQMFKTLQMVDRIQPTQCSAYVFYPFPRTKLHDKAVELGYLDEDGQDKVRRGISGYHHESILRHPHKELAETLAKVTPVYARTSVSLPPTSGRDGRRDSARHAMRIVTRIPSIPRKGKVSGIRQT